jgi:PEP-CTERM motif-containing protein
MLKGKNLWGAAAVALVTGVAAPSAQAAYIVTLEEQGISVVATGSGTIDTTDLTFLFNGSALPPLIEPNDSSIIVGIYTTTYAEYGGSFSGPSNFGSGNNIQATTGSGDFVGIVPINGNFFVPTGYVSDTNLSSSATWTNATFASIGVTLGTYTWTWGSGVDADSFTLQIGAAPDVPEPTSLLLLSTGMLGFGAVFRRKRTAPKFAV